MKSFDGLPISAFVYRPDPKKFPGKRPLMLNIHGGGRPDASGDSRAKYYYLNKLALRLCTRTSAAPPVTAKRSSLWTMVSSARIPSRTSARVLDWIKSQPDWMPTASRSSRQLRRYMSLACMEHYHDRLRCGIDVVGISNFIYPEEYADYRRDLRRVEYGDERDLAMHEFLEKISPTTNVKTNPKTLFVVQGKNDPRVNVTESENMVKAIRDNGARSGI